MEVTAMCMGKFCIVVEIAHRGSVTAKSVTVLQLDGMSVEEEKITCDT